MPTWPQASRVWACCGCPNTWRVCRWRAASCYRINFNAGDRIGLTVTSTGVGGRIELSAGLSTATVMTNGSTVSASDVITRSVVGGPHTTFLRYFDQGVVSGAAQYTIGCVSVASTVSGSSPPTGIGGTSVTINGSALLGATAVYFGGVPAATFTVNSDTRITAVAPAGSGTVALSVRTDTGTATGGSFTYVPPPVLAAAPLPDATGGVGYSQSLQASGVGAPLGYAVVSGALPGGMQLDPDGRLWGTATAAGSFTFRVRVTDVFGQTGEQTLTLQVLAPPITLAPATLADGQVGVGYSVQFNATGGNGNYTYALTSGVLPPGLRLDPTGQLSGTPAASGSYDATISATDRQGFTGSQAYTLRIAAAAPQPIVATLQTSTTAGGRAVVQLTDQAQGGPFTAATLLSVLPAAAGTARIDAAGSGADARYRMTFTAAADFDGIARIGYTLTNAHATSAPGTVEVKVAARPDPSRDAEVSGLLAAQAAAARRFGIAQIGNFQQRMESLHRGEGSGGFRNGLSFSADGRCQNQSRHLPGSDCAQQALNDEAAAREASSVTDGAGRNGNAGQIGIWTGGAISRGDRDAVDDAGGFEFETSGVSAGADYRVDRAFAIGGGVGYGRDDSDIGFEGTRSESDSYSLAVYASYHPGEVFFLDGLAGYQWLSYDLRRHVTTNGAQVHGERDGTQWFGSLSLGAELRRHRLQVAPYARWDIARGTLDGYTESGDELYALRHADQDVNTSTGNLGVRIDYRIPTAFGSIAPRFLLEYQHDFQADGTATMSYADMLSGPFHRTNIQSLEQNRLMFGIGAVLETEHDLGLRLEYRGLFQSDHGSDHGVLLNLEKKF